MKKYLKYELKKNLWALVIITAVLLFAYVPEMMSFEMTYEWQDEFGNINKYMQSPRLSAIITNLVILCFVVPILTYSFKMNKRSVDAYYSMPLKKEKLFFVKTVMGLILVLLPFTITYWSGFLVLLCREGNPYDMSWYAPAYFGAIALAVLLYGFNSFIFTRANKIADGVVFMLGFTFLGYMIIDYLDNEFSIFTHWWISTSFSSIGTFVIFVDGIEELIMNRISDDWSIWSFAYITIVGVLGYVFLFYALRFEKAENAEQISDNIVGYRTLIVLYAGAILGMSEFSFISYALVAVYEIVATVVYQRKFRFKKKEWIRILLGLLLGMVLYFIGNIF